MSELTFDLAHINLSAPVSTASGGATYSREEVAVAVRSLPDAEKTALVKIARLYARNTQFSHDDLVQESVCRVLEGRRLWPRALPGRVFFCGVIRSIAWEWKDELVDTESDAGDEGAAERGANAWLDAKAIIGLFDDDPAAQSIVLGMMEGLRGEELEEASGLTQTDYQSKRKKVRRRLEKMLTRVTP